MENKTNIEVLDELHADVLMKLRAIRLLIAAELGVTVGEVSVSTMCSTAYYESVHLHVGDRVTSVIERSLGPDAIDTLIERYRTLIERYRQDITIPAEEVEDD